MKVTVSVGPGPYASDLLLELRRRSLLYRAIEYWPDFKAVEYGPGGATALRAHSRTYQAIVWATWATWRRVPYYRRFETPRSLVYGLYDRLARRHIEGCDVFVGWSQVSLRSLGAAKRTGALAFLEHPMVHVNTWMSIMEREYCQFGGQTTLFYSLFPSSVVRRMLKEYEVADVINVPSSFARQTFVANGVSASKLVVTSLGVDAESFGPAACSDGHPFRVLYAGRMELLKGVHYLLQAYHELDLSDAELWLAGPLLPELEPFFRRHAGQFRHFGHLNQEQLRPIYQSASVFVLPSVQEGFGLVILEAMACGLPVIATSSTGGPDIIRDGVDGFIVPPGDVEALKDRLLRLHRDRELRRAMSVEARKRVESRFTRAQYGERFAGQLTAAAGRRG